jgi:hypothetical protein
VSARIADAGAILFTVLLVILQIRHYSPAATSTDPPTALRRRRST